MMNNLGSFWYISHTNLHTFGLFFNLAEDLNFSFTLLYRVVLIDYLID